MTIVNSVGDSVASSDRTWVRSRGFPGAGRLKFTKKARAKNEEPVKLRIATWNVGTMTARSKEIEEVMDCRKIDILCVQETRWKNLSNKTRFLDRETKKYKFFYHGVDNAKNGVGIIISEKWCPSIINVQKISDRLMAVKLVLQGKIWNIISAYAPQTGSDANEKLKFWDDLEALIQNIPMEEKKFIGSDLNGHVGELNHGYEECHGGYGFGVRNLQGEEILDFAKAFSLTILNTWFKKQTKHLVTSCQFD